jgi:uncharacterized circularly permuted ATP-grasp superfamily protein
MFSATGTPRPHYRALAVELGRLSFEEFEERRHAVELSFVNQGIGFTVYGQEEGLERIFPFDLIPRVIPGAEWDRLERGPSSGCARSTSCGSTATSESSVTGRFLARSCSAPATSCARWRVEPPGGVYAHVASVDVIRDDNGDYLVLEDNLRTPSGASYMLENRAAMKRTFSPSSGTAWRGSTSTRRSSPC